MAFADYFKKEQPKEELAPVTVKEVLETKPAAEPENIKFWLSYNNVQELQKLFAGSTIKNGDDLLDKLRRSQQVRLNDGIDILLTTDELWQLKQQSMGMRRDYQEYAKEQLEDALSLYLNGCVRLR